MIGKLGKTVQYTNDILRGVNTTVWGGVENSKKIGKAVTTGLTGAVTKKYTTYTTAVTVYCRTVRAYCKNSGTYLVCTLSVFSTAKEAVKNKILK